MVLFNLEICEECKCNTCKNEDCEISTFWYGKKTFCLLCMEQKNQMINQIPVKNCREYKSE